MSILMMILTFTVYVLCIYISTYVCVVYYIDTAIHCICMYIYIYTCIYVYVYNKCM